MLPKMRKNKYNKIARWLITFILLLMICVVGVKCVELRAKRAEYIEKESELEVSISVEEKRAEEIAEYETYTQTKAYVEEIARDKLGLVYQGEILFKDEN